MTAMTDGVLGSVAKFANVFNADDRLTDLTDYESI